MFPGIRFGEGKLPRSKAYYYLVAVGIIGSWIADYVAIIMPLLLFCVPEAERAAAPRFYYIMAMLGELAGPVVFLWRLRVVNDPRRRGGPKPGAP